MTTGLRLSGMLMVGTWLLSIAFIGPSFAQTSTSAGWAPYSDPKTRFTFSYPAAFGNPQPRTHIEYVNRVTAVSFSSPSGSEGEAVLTSGPVVLDAAPLGGVYDPIILQALPDELRKKITAALTPITRDNFCSLLGAANRLNATTALPDNIKEVARSIDQWRNIDPKVVQCARKGDIVTFYKEATFAVRNTKVRQHIFGAIRFLSDRYSSFQFVRIATSPPETAALDVATHLVNSFALR